MFSQTEIRLHFVVDCNDIRSTDWLRLIKNEVFVLTVLAREVLLEFDVEVRLN